MDPAKECILIRRFPIPALAALLLTGCDALAGRSAPGDWTTDAAQAAEPARPLAIADTFDGGLCTERCPGAIWYYRQQVDGRVSVVADPRRRGGVLKAETGPRQGRIAKAALVARFAPLPPGTRAAIAFDVMIPAGAPRNSIHLLDIECAECGQSGNPGIRLYLRNGRLRIDRAKIGIERAWTNDRAPPLQPGVWHRIEALVDLDRTERGGIQIRLDGREVLSGRGRTMLGNRGSVIDRLQLGVTANSNPFPATAYFDDFSARLIN